jgi:hypothetical protein
MARPSPPPYWKRPPEESRRRWAEIEWEKWCKSRGMMPKEFTDEDRERFLRSF